MDQKLRRWLEGRCRALPDGRWLVEVPVVREPPAPAFVLPDEPTKEAYLSRAVRVGRVRLLSALLILVGVVPLFLPRVLSAPNGSILDALTLATPFWGLALLILSALVPWWMSLRLRGWLKEVGTEVGASDSIRAGGARTARSVLGPFNELMRCRPAWIVTAEMVVVGVVSACLAHHATPGNAGCHRTLEALTEIPAPIELTVLCSTPSSVLQPLLVAAFLTFMALAWRDWWRWNRRGG